MQLSMHVLICLIIFLLSSFTLASPLSQSLNASSLISHSDLRPREACESKPGPDGTYRCWQGTHIDFCNDNKQWEVQAICGPGDHCHQYGIDAQCWTGNKGGEGSLTYPSKDAWTSPYHRHMGECGCYKGVDPDERCSPDQSHIWRCTEINTWQFVHNCSNVGMCKRPNWFANCVKKPAKRDINAVDAVDAVNYIDGVAFQDSAAIPCSQQGAYRCAPPDQLDIWWCRPSGNWELQARCEANRVCGEIGWNAQCFDKPSNDQVWPATVEWNHPSNRHTKECDDSTSVRPFGGPFGRCSPDQPTQRWDCYQDKWRYAQDADF